MKGFLERLADRSLRQAANFNGTAVLTGILWVTAMAAGAALYAYFFCGK